MTDIMLPRPDNVRGRFGSYVTSDVFHIAERLQELSPRLYVQAHDDPINWHGHTYNFTVCELVPPGLETFVARYETLDGRVVKDCERMLHVPFEQRFAEFEKLEAKWEEEEHQRKLDELYEQMGGQMWVDLERCGFIQRPVSYAKTNKTARRHRHAKGLVGVRV